MGYTSPPWCSPPPSPSVWSAPLLLTILSLFPSAHPLCSPFTSLSSVPLVPCSHTLYPPQCMIPAHNSPPTTNYSPLLPTLYLPECLYSVPLVPCSPTLYPSPPPPWCLLSAPLVPCKLHPLPLPLHGACSVSHWFPVATPFTPPLPPPWCLLSVPLVLCSHTSVNLLAV